MDQKPVFSAQSTRRRAHTPIITKSYGKNSSPEGVRWVEEEFDALWADAYQLPDAILEEVKRIADRVEIRFEETTPEELPAAALAETPIYRGGEIGSPGSAPL